MSAIRWLSNGQNPRMQCHEVNRLLAHRGRNRLAGFQLLFWALLGLIYSGGVFAHRLSPGYFGLTETVANSFAAEWKVSIPGGLADVLEPQIPAGCMVSGNVRRFTLNDSRLMHARIQCNEGLAGKQFTVVGLNATDTDVLLRIAYLDGTSFTHRLVPDDDSVEIPVKPGTWDIVVTYFELGVEHILFGIDHLLFVLALILLVDGFKRLVATITAFTIAHSLTLAGAALGYVNVPQAPVEAVIALSIIFLATELARRPQSSSGDSLANRWPWLVAFVFGLLHGFGFAGALADIGLPGDAIPLALLVFNVGVEIGQLLFIAVILGLLACWRSFRLPAPRWVAQLTIYGVGSIAALWFFERTVSLI